MIFKRLHWIIISLRSMRVIDCGSTSLACGISLPDALAMWYPAESYRLITRTAGTSSTAQAQVVLTF